MERILRYNRVKKLIFIRKTKERLEYIEPVNFDV